MKHRNIFPSTVVQILFCFSVIFWYGNQYATLPQPGQNIRSVCQQTGTDVDTLLGTFTLVTADFNATFTALAAISSLIISDFNGTFTALAAASACGAIPLFQTSVINGGMLLTTSGASYCLSQNITGSIIISAADVTVDLNTHSLVGTIDILSTATNATIKNGNVKPATPTSVADSAHAAIVIASTVDKALIKNCYIICTDSTILGHVGRDGIANGGTNTIIDSCFIQAGVGSGSGNGGNGITVTNSACQITDNTILAGSGFTNLYAYVANSGSNTISGFSIVSTGSLAPISGSPFSTGTPPRFPTISPDGSKLYVGSNAGVFGFSLLATGSLVPLAGSPFVGGGGSVGVTLTPDGTKLYAALFNTAQVAGYRVNKDTGALTLVSGSPFTAGTQPWHIAITPDNRYLYVTNSTGTTITSFSINQTTGVLTSLGDITVGANPKGIAITPDGTRIYVANNNPSNISGFSINSTTGALTPLSGSPYAVGLFPTSLIITRDGTKLYVSNSGGSTIGGYSINATTGALAALPGSPFATGGSLPEGLAITPDGTKLYSANVLSNNVIGFSINQTTGALTLLPTSPFPSPSAPEGIVINPLASGGAGISQQGNNGKIINNIVSGGTGTIVGGAGIQVTSSTNDNIIKSCIATNCGDSGYSMLTTGTVNILDCVANYNTGNGFDLASSTGKGLVNDCVASGNVGCGFNDRVASLYQYIGNSSEGNGSTPAVPTSDTNYCTLIASNTLANPALIITTTFVTPSGPGFAPYYQNARRADGTFNGTSNWDNITLN